MTFASELASNKLTSLRAVKKSGACVGILDATQMFYSNSRPIRVNAIQMYCARCSVRSECYTISLINREIFGVWGGFDELARRNIESIVRVKLNETKPEKADHYDIKSPLTKEYYDAVQAFATDVAVAPYEQSSLKRDKTERKRRANPLVVKS